MERRQGGLEDLVMTPAFWKDQKIFITGHTGFKGSWLSVWLQLLGAKLCGYSLAPPTNPNLFTLVDVERHMSSIEADIRNRRQLESAMQSFKPAIVMHLAAQSLVRNSYVDPVETYETNVLGTVNVLEAARMTDSVKTIIIVTSDKCYKNYGWSRGYHENDELGGHDPYSNSKACAELVTSAYVASFFDTRPRDKRVAVASVRAGNVIGGGDWAEDRLIPDLFRAFSKGVSAEIRSPNATRPWQHVLEPLSGYLELAEKIGDQPELAGAWNFGPEFSDAKTVASIADRLVDLWGNNAVWHADKSEHPHEANLLRLDCSKAQAELNWSPRIDLDSALELTVDWYKAYADSKSMREITAAQIRQFQNMEIAA